MRSAGEAGPVVRAAAKSARNGDGGPPEMRGAIRGGSDRAFRAAARLPLLLIVILLGHGLPAGAAQPDPLATLDTCIGRLDPQVDVGYERIARRCPDLAPALEQSGWAAWLPRAWKESRNDLSSGSLRELRDLVARELATRTATQAPRVARLKDILTELGNSGQQRTGAWTRFKQWVRSLFERAGNRDRQGWLDRLIARVGVSDAAIEVITYIALALVVALAGFIVFNELRLAGLLGRRRDEAGNGGESSGPANRARPTWSDVERAALLDRPRLLLELIAAKLTDLNRLPPASAFTARELARAADLSQAADRERLGELAFTAERVRYARDGVPPELAEKAVVEGRELLLRLETGGAEQPAGPRAVA